MGIDHSHGHGHAHEHSDEHHPHHEAAEDKERRNVVLKKLQTASLLCFTFFLVEVIGGLLAGSLAVLSDAAHLAADLSAFLVAIIGFHIASLPASASHTYGLKRTESLAALFSMVCLVILSIVLAVEATHRVWIILYVGGEEFQVDGKLMSMIASVGVVVNIILAFVLGEDHAHLPLTNANKRNVNLHAAYIHVLADLAQSVVVLLAGVIIWYKPTWQLTDPICTLIFSIMVCYATVGVIRSSLSVLLEEVPPCVNYDEVFDAISDVEGVSNVHDLHIWSISHDKLSLSVHASAANIEQAYRDIKHVCHRAKITHLTLQLQPNTEDVCVTCPDGMAHQCIRDPVKRTGSSVH
ncbi:hypothetical protein ACHAXA_005963 [Cyclostephanos tholiformis]|uniref:Uncharacterized protein n=1 Tax=Cyclostephanos tholiformis TaxID=382380 RepID=A0ABD3SEI6_9STRA